MSDRHLAGRGPPAADRRTPREAARPSAARSCPAAGCCRRETQRLFARLYLEGLSSGDFEPAFRELLGEAAPLSSSTILRLKEEWEAEYAGLAGAAADRPIRLIWADGIYLGAGDSSPSTAACW